MGRRKGGQGRIASRREREGRRGEGKGEKDVLRVLWFVFLRVVKTQT